MTLPPCPSSATNCVSTEATERCHAVAPFLLARAAAWPAIRAAVVALPRTRIVEEGADFLRVECRTILFRFVDDLVIQLRLDRNDLAIRSASRLGHYDFGVNRRRVESLRRRLEARGAIKASA
ncbi:MAG: DUF1499 domain-containing protein [Chthoniobacterales bacterium]|nr:DUF1499 domain-containing protein [Chthoniobacterales bacterium]